MRHSTLRLQHCRGVELNGQEHHGDDLGDHERDEHVHRGHDVGREDDDEEDAPHEERDADDATDDNHEVLSGGDVLRCHEEADAEDDVDDGQDERDGDDDRLVRNGQIVRTIFLRCVCQWDTAWTGGVPTAWGGGENDLRIDHRDDDPERPYAEDAKHQKREVRMLLIVGLGVHDVGPEVDGNDQDGEKKEGRDFKYHKVGEGLSGKGAWKVKL